MKKIIAIIALTVLALPVCFSQLEVQNPKAETKPDSLSNQGFYVNEGKLKLTQLECYNFGDMIVVFDIKPEYFSYDYIYIDLYSGETSNGYDIHGQIVYSKEDFFKGNGGKDYAYYYVFYTKDLAEKSRFEFTRANLEYAIGLLSVKGVNLRAVLTGSIVKGTKTVYSTTGSGDVVAREKEVESYTKLEEFSIPMLNRKKAAPIKFGTKQDLPTVTGDCYK